MKSYHEEWEPAYSPQLVIEEASRCLLCLDAPCSASCPAGTDPAKFIRSIRFRNFKGAVETIRINNAFGAVCARVCPTEKYCQKGCTRSGIDRPIDIGRIQRYATDFEANIKMEVYHKAPATGKKVAIIGAGPAGLQAAASLALKGHEVVVYEEQEKPGGWLRYGIPTYRLPNEIVDTEIDRIVRLGVRVICNTYISEEKLMQEILPQYDAVLLSSGTPKGRVFDLFKDNPYVETAVDFLARVKNQEQKESVKDNVLIVGGGDVAMDAATTLKALGAKNVTVVAREEMDHFPSSQEEYQLAHEMNVSIIDGYTPENIEGNVVTFKHVQIPGKLTIQADAILLACGQHSSVENWPSFSANRGEFVVENGQLGQSKLFAAGDIVPGDKSVVYAVKTGKIAAQAIDSYLGGK